jgi:hypothetical protein
MSDGYTRAQILENRRKWIDFLKLPDTKKGTGKLESSADNTARCCLGHACHVLIPETRKVIEFDNGEIVKYGEERSYAPYLLKNKLGLYDVAGSNDLRIEFQIGSYETRGCLAAYNDGTDITPQEIGAYLETVIEGGRFTPFKPLIDYPE